MTIQDSRSEYAKRMHRVLEHVDRHLDAALELSTLAAVANFSPFHFHRLFSAWTGETVGDYLRRRRLEVGALRLVSQPGTTVLQVALSVGFGSSEAFARAFKVHFGASPTAWRARERKHRNPDQMKRNPDQESRAGSAHFPTSPSNHREVVMKVTLIERKPANIAYMRHVGAYGEPISKFWQTVVAPWMGTNNLFGHVRYGISHDDPGIASPERARYDAGVEVDSNFSGTGDYHTTLIPGGRYACAHFSGTTADIVGAWAKLLREWLPESGMQLDSRPFFEYYDQNAKFDPKTGVFSCDLCIPVVAL
ncbi:MAG: AraC family transcriptional regulator [Gemmatimonadaceae bacterium]